jgi:hypothetical protein
MAMLRLDYKGEAGLERPLCRTDAACRRNTCIKTLSRRFVVQGFSRSLVELSSHLVQPLLGVN